MDFDAMVPRDGDRMTASGRVVRDETGDHFEPELPVLAIGGPRGVRHPWEGAVPVVGVEFNELSRHLERDGVEEGFATLAGAWSSGQLLVDHQAPPEPVPHAGRQWMTPPCPAPEGGWPQPRWLGPDKNLDYDLGDLRETGAAVGISVFRPSEDQAVLVVAAADPAAVETLLRPQLGPLLCVVPSKWTTAQLEAVRSHLHAHHQRWRLYRWGYGPTTDDGQARIEARLSWMQPDAAAWAASLPAGILDLDPWLKPVPQ
jgi:hypothetical protein